MMRAEPAWTVYESPLGPLTLVGDDDALWALHFPGRSGPLNEAARDSEPFTDAIGQLEEYFAGERRRFELSLRLEGSPFQRRVWAALQEIPFGATRSYGALAGGQRRRAARARVGGSPALAAGLAAAAAASADAQAASSGPMVRPASSRATQ